MNIIRKIIMFLLIVPVFLLIAFIFMIIFDKINPPYHILEDGTRGYYMNTGNIFFAIISSFFTVILLVLLSKKLKKSS